MNVTSLGEMQQREIDAAARLVRLTAGHALAVTELFAALARDLLELSANEARALAATTDALERVRVRLHHDRQAAQLMIETARRIAEAGNVARNDFSRLLTEQLASGSHELMDAFQAYFKVLPTPNATIVAMLRLAMERSERAFGDIDDALAQAAAASGPVAKRRRLAAKKAPYDAPALEPVVAERALPGAHV
jgi:hypothetical protein